MRVLIVDDELGICQRLQRELQKEGCEVEYTTSAIGVLKRLKSAEREGKTYALLLLDLRMPKVDGLSLLKEIRQARLGLEVVIITGYGDEDKAIESIRLGAVDYLPKPISLEALHTAVFRVQQKRAAEEKKALEYSVLVVDDEKELCERIKRELDKEGYRTAVAYDGVEGLDYFSHNRVDVAIVDIKMPRMSGLEMLKKCREISDDFVSIIITGHGDHERAIQALQLGAFNYLRKPISLEELVTSVGKGIELLHLRRDLAARRRELEIETALKEQYANNLEKMVEERTKEIKKLSDAVKASTESIVISDLEGKITDVNEATLRMYGTGNKEDLVGKSSFDLIAPEDREKAVAAMEEVLEKGYVKDREYHVITKDGSKLPVEMSVSIMKGMDGEPIGFVGITMNITERKRAAEELHRKEEHHKAVIENIFKFVPEGVLVLTESLNLLKQNKAFDDIVQKYAPLLGYTEEELAQKIIEQLRRKIESEDSKEIHIGKNDQLETGISGRDELIFQFNTARMFLAEEEEEEEEATIVISLSDVTERKTAEDLLHKSEAKFRKLISSLPDAVLVVNTEGRITLFNNNATKIFGYTQDEMLNCTIEDLIPKHNREHHLEERNKYLSKPASRAMGEGRELFALRKDGSEFPTEIMLEPVEINNKLVILTIVRDVTTRKKMLEDLIAAKDTAEAANSLKDAFIANISHEIRTPLNGILGLTSLIKDIYSQYIQEEDKELFSGIEDSSKRIIRTVDMILNYSRLQVGEFPISPEVLNLSSICGSLINEFRAAAESASIALAFENKSENANIFADDYSITQIISNLIDNAIKYTKKGYVKVILYNESNDELLLDIKDSGIGIAEDYLNEIFVPYIQEEMGYGRAYEGVGLGLPLVNQFIELNNIKISVVSKKGEGTTFTINFGMGISAAEETEKNGVADVMEQLEDHKILKVLLVEDDSANQITVQRFLGRRYSVLTADSSDAAINILEKNNIDVILMDISIKGKKNGLELTKELKESKEYSHIPIIAVTAHAFEKDKQNAFDAGCDDYISKPFTKELLLDTIAKIV